MPIFIGDVHGLYTQYKRIIREHTNTIQVGDMGVGFRRLNGSHRENPPYDLMLKKNARFIRGNHDNPEVCRKHSQWIHDGSVEDDMMFVGGAFSIDREYRTKEYSWWEDEELSLSQLVFIHDAYVTIEPACMVTHDCPVTVIKHMHSHHLFDNSRTQQALEAMWQKHKPKVWVFGHHHKSFDQVIDGTRFVCLDELEVKEINWRIIT
jgi:predicted phosphodiesterase